MAAAVGQVKHATADAAAATIAATFTSATGANGCITGFVDWFGSATTDLTSVTDNKSGGSNTYTIVDAVAFGGIAGLFRASFIAANAGSATTVTAHFSPNAQFRRIEIQEITGADTSSPLNAHHGQSQSAPGTGSNAVSSGSFTSTVNNCLILGSTGCGTSSTIPSVGTGFTSADSLNNASDGDAQIVESKTLGTAGSTSVTFTTTAGTGEFVTLGMAIAPAVAAAPTVTDVNSGDVIKAGDTGDTMTGTNLGTGTADRTFELVQGSVAVTQTQTAGTSTTGTFTVVTEPGGAAIKFGATTFLVTRVSDSAQGTRAITVNPATGQLYVDLTSVNAASAYRITASGDLAVGDQLHARGVGGGAAPTGLSLGADGTFSFSAGNTPASFDVRVWAASDSTWGAFATQTIGAGTPSGHGLSSLGVGA